VGDKLVDPLLFRIRIHSMSGLRATDEKEASSGESVGNFRAQR